MIFIVSRLAPGVIDRAEERLIMKTSSVAQNNELVETSTALCRVERRFTTYESLIHWRARGLIGSTKIVTVCQPRWSGNDNN